MQLFISHAPFVDYLMNVKLMCKQTKRQKLLHAEVFTYIMLYAYRLVPCCIASNYLMNEQRVKIEVKTFSILKENLSSYELVKKKKKTHTYGSLYRRDFF